MPPGVNCGVGNFFFLFGWLQQEKVLVSFFKEKIAHKKKYKTTLNSTLITSSNPGEKQRAGVDDNPRLREAGAGSVPRGQREQPANGGDRTGHPQCPLTARKIAAGFSPCLPQLHPWGLGLQKVFEGALTRFFLFFF